MDKLKSVAFSKEIVNFSKIVDKTFSDVSKDINILTNKVSLSIKENKLDIDNINKEINILRNSLSLIKTSIIDIEKKIKRINLSPSVIAKPLNNKEDIKFLSNEISEIKLSIKNIEHKLKLD